MDNSKIKSLQLFNDKKFFISEIDDNSYVFYNSIKHFACKIGIADLVLLNLIYIHKDKDEIISNIDLDYKDYMSKFYDKVMESGALDVTPIDKAQHIDNLQEPTSFYLHLTYKCNLGCIYCYNKDIRLDYKELDLKDWIVIIDKIIPYAQRIVLTGGEPFLNKQISEIVTYIRTKSEKITIEVISNCMVDFSKIAAQNNCFKKITQVTFSCDNLSNINLDLPTFTGQKVKQYLNI